MLFTEQGLDPNANFHKEIGIIKSTQLHTENFQACVIPLFHHQAGVSINQDGAEREYENFGPIFPIIKW